MADTNLHPAVAAKLEAIRVEYAAKYQEYQQAWTAEKNALVEGNAAAAQQAQEIQLKLTTELTALKTSFDSLKTSASNAETNLASVQQQLEDVKSQYDVKMAALLAARKEEVDALTAKNSQLVASSRAEQDALTTELVSLKTKYEELVKRQAQCPIIPEQALVVDGGDGQMFRFENGVLRPMSQEVYRSLGSPGYTTWPAGTLTNCAKGTPLVVVQTTTPPPQPEPTTVPRFGGTIYVLVDAMTWKRDGQLKVLSSRFGGLAIEPFEFKSVDQVFLLNDAGYMRSLTARGPYVTSSADCLVPSLETDPPAGGWRIQRAGQSPLGYRVISSCGSRLMSSGRDVMLDTAAGDGGEEWYIIPVGSAKV